MFGQGSALWVNGTLLAMLSNNAQGRPTPDNAFPFTRLASVTLADHTATFLYHQINATTFAEEEWDDSLSAWLPSTFITVSSS